MEKKILSHLPQWISVEDSLPECLNKVLMLNANGTIKVGLHNGEYWTAEDGCSFWATYWMPIPEPPKTK